MSSERQPITDAQKVVVRAILNYWIANGMAPKLRDLGKILHIASPNGIMCHLKALEKKGWLDRDKKKAGMMWIVGQRDVIREAVESFAIRFRQENGL